jgi:predicted transcriptional regulator
VGAAFALHEPFRWRWLAALAPLYTRLAKSQILESQLREAIHGYVQEHPGAHLRQIQRDLGLHNGSMLYHVAVLEREQFLRAQRDGMYKRYYVTGTAPAIPGADPLAHQVQTWIASNPGKTNAELAEALGKRPSLMHYHVSRLEEQGLARKEREGRDVRIWPVARP